MTSGVLEIDAEKIDNWMVYETQDITDSLDVVGAVLQPDGQTVRITLAEGMEDETEYYIKALFLRDYGYSLSVDVMGVFVCPSTIATLLAEHSVVCTREGVELMWTLAKPARGDISFLVMRAEGIGSGFVPVGAVEAPTDGRSFTFVDGDVEPGGKYAYRVEYSQDGVWRVLFETGGIEVPLRRLALHQNHPNPFNPSTVIIFDLSEGGAVWLTVFDVSGRLVRRLLDGEMLDSGRIRREWDGRNDNGEAVASGVYYYKLRAGRETLTRKMVLMR